MSSPQETRNTSQKVSVNVKCDKCGADYKVTIDPTMALATVGCGCGGGMGVQLDQTVLPMVKTLRQMVQELRETVGALTGELLILKERKQQEKAAVARVIAGLCEEQIWPEGFEQNRELVSQILSEIQNIQRDRVDLLLALKPFAQVYEEIQAGNFGGLPTEALLRAYNLVQGSVALKLAEAQHSQENTAQPDP